MKTKRSEKTKQVIKIAEIFPHPRPTEERFVLNFNSFYIVKFYETQKSLLSEQLLSFSD